MRAYHIVKCVKFAVIATVIVAAVGWAVTLLWNVLVPPIFGAREITFWQAVGLFVLARILVGGFGRHGHGHGRAWKRRMNEKWHGMTPQEREKFRAAMDSRCRFTGGRRTKEAPDDERGEML
jgi:hypothetical protein